MNKPILVTDLIFKKIPLADAQQFKCNYCGKIGLTVNWWMTTVRFLKSAEFKIVLCSDACKISFEVDPKSQPFIDGCIEDMTKVHRLDLKKKLIATPSSDHGHN